MGVDDTTTFVGMEDQNPWPGLAFNQNFTKGRGVKPKVKMSKLRDVESKLVYRNSYIITDGDLGAKPPTVAQFLVIFWKKSYFNAFGSHFAHVKSYLKELDF